MVEPPASPGDGVSLYFPHPEWNHMLGDNFSTDIRPVIDISDTMQVWNFSVLSTDGGEATLVFDVIESPKSLWFSKILRQDMLSTSITLGPILLVPLLVLSMVL